MSDTDSSTKKISTQLFETKIFMKTQLVICLVIYFLFVLVASLITIAIPTLYKSESSSLWKCPPYQPRFDEKCNGTDIREFNSSKPFIFVNQNDAANQLFTAFQLVPHHTVPNVGFNFRVNITYDVTNMKDNSVQSFVNNSFLIHCGLRQDFCDPVLLFSGAPGIYKFSGYLESEDPEIIKYIKQTFGDVNATIVAGNPSSSYFLLAYRYVLLVITLGVFCWYMYMYLTNSDIKTAEQKWIILYAIAAILFDNPLYIINVFTSSSFMQYLDALFNAAFYAFAMTFILVILGGFITRQTTIIGFHVPRIVFCVIFFAIYLAQIISQMTVATVQTVLNNERVRTGLSVTMAVFALIWGFWFFYTVVRVGIITKQHPRAIKGRYRVFVVFVISVTLVFFALLAASVLTEPELSARLTLASHVFAASGAWMLLVWLAPTSLERATSTSLESALHPKREKETQLSQFGSETAQGATGLVAAEETTAQGREMDGADSSDVL